MDDLFADERIQFFLRNRADIKVWAAIESDVMAATRDLLARAQPAIEERILAIDPDALVGRGDGGQRERIMARRGHWPPSVGLTLEWNRSVDPLGNERPKLGVFWWADPPTLVEPRNRFATAVDKQSLQRLGYKIPLEGVWPVGMWITSSPDWWRDPPAWMAGIVDLCAQAWPLVAPHIDAVLPDNWQVSGG
ncbi:MAG: hypothetical protein QOJ81_1752 [Chloroflexota bacterium]|jgi:hypothetical protein|nr:hypothetical protein [Chloroflexota bacterium]